MSERRLEQIEKRKDFGVVRCGKIAEDLDDDCVGICLSMIGVVCLVRIFLKRNQNITPKLDGNTVSVYY